MSNVLQQVRQGTLGVSVTVNNVAVPIYLHNGAYYFEAGKPGETYAISVYNANRKRQEVVVSVDGVDTNSGKSASYAEGGLVLRPWSTWSFKGFRTNLELVASFTFASQEGGSYAEKMGHGSSNLGIIGVAAFEEKEVVAPPVIIPLHPDLYPKERNPSDPWRRVPVLYSSNCSVGSSLASSVPTAAIPKSKSYVGTEFGPSQQSVVGTTSFTRQSPSVPNTVITLMYKAREDLVQMGVISSTPIPNPFPGNPPAVAGFCPAPPQ